MLGIANFAKKSHDLPKGMKSFLTMTIRRSIAENHGARYKGDNLKFSAYANTSEDNGRNFEEYDKLVRKTRTEYPKRLDEIYCVTDESNEVPDRTWKDFPEKKENQNKTKSAESASQSHAQKTQPSRASSLGRTQMYRDEKSNDKQVSIARRKHSLDIKRLDEVYYGQKKSPEKVTLAQYVVDLNNKGGLAKDRHRMQNFEQRVVNSNSNSNTVTYGSAHPYPKSEKTCVLPKLDARKLAQKRL